MAWSKIQSCFSPLQHCFSRTSASFSLDAFLVVPGNLTVLLGSYDTTGASKRKGWASVLSTHLSRGRVPGSPNSSHRYLSVSAIQKLSMPFPGTAGSLVTSCSIRDVHDAVCAYSLHRH